MQEIDAVETEELCIFLAQALEGVYQYYGRHRLDPYYAEPKVWIDAREALQRAKTVAMARRR